MILQKEQIPNESMVKIDIHLSVIYKMIKQLGYDYRNSKYKVTLQEGGWEEEYGYVTSDHLRCYIKVRKQSKMLWWTFQNNHWELIIDRHFKIPVTRGDCIEQLDTDLLEHLPAIKDELAKFLAKVMNDKLQDEKEIEDLIGGRF
mgnify:CR=1 FL=1